MIIANNETTSSAVLCRAEIGVAMIRIVLCDDNKHFMESLRAEIRTILSKNKIDAVIYTYENAEAIPEHLLTSSDIFFLDIDFSGKQYTGIDIARKIRQVRENSVLVFITNFIEYAPEGYEVQAFRYLLKRDIHNKLEQCLLQSLEKLHTEQETMQINISGEILTLPLVEILYIESQGHLAIIHATRKGSQTEKTYRFYSSLTSLEQQLSTQGFLRIQKSYLVNMRRIQKYQCTEATLDNGIRLKVSEKNYAEQKRQYLLWKGRQ